MLNLYETYASEEERQNAAYLESAEIAMDRAMLAMDTCDSMRDIAMREAELQYMTESCDVTELSSYYEAADEKTDAKREGLFQAAWRKICDFFKTIKEKLFGKEPTIDPNAEYEVNKSDVNDLNLIEKAWASLKNFSKHPLKSSLQILATITGIVAGIAILGYGGKKIAGTVKIKGKPLSEMFKRAKKVNNEMNDEADRKSKTGAKDSDPEADKGIRKLFSDIGKAIRGVAQNFINAPRNKIYAVKNAHRTNQNDYPNNEGDYEDPSAYGDSAEDPELGAGVDFFGEDATSFDDLLGAEEYQEAAEDFEVAELLAAF